MIQQKQLKALVLAGFLGVMTLAPTSEAQAATGWQKSGNEWVYYDTDG